MQQAKMSIGIFILLYTLVLTACQAPGTQPGVEPIDEVKSITPTPGQPSLEMNASSVIFFERSGGITGITEQWDIFENGKVINNTPGKEPATIEYTIDAIDVSSLIMEIEASGFFESNLSSGSGLSQCKDCYTYKLTVRAGDKERTITLSDGAKNIPDSVWAILTQIKKLIANPSQ